jgi:hypothetical protein
LVKKKKLKRLAQEKKVFLANFITCHPNRTPSESLAVTRLAESKDREVVIGNIA